MAVGNVAQVVGNVDSKGQQDMAVGNVAQVVGNVAQVVGNEVRDSPVGSVAQVGSVVQAVGNVAVGSEAPGKAEGTRGKLGKQARDKALAEVDEDRAAASVELVVDLDSPAELSDFQVATPTPTRTKKLSAPEGVGGGFGQSSGIIRLS